MYNSFEQLAADLPTNGVIGIKYISDEDKNVLKQYLNSLKYGQDKPDISILSEDEKLILYRLIS